MSDRHYRDMREIWESLPEGTDAQTACEAFAKVSADAERPLVEALREAEIWTEIGLRVDGRYAGDGTYSSSYTRCIFKDCEYLIEEYGDSLSHSEHCLVSRIRTLLATYENGDKT